MRPLRTPAEAKGTEPSRRAAARLARRGRSGAGAPRAAPAGFRSPRGLRAAGSAGAVLLRAPAGSLRYLLQTQATSLGAPSLSPESWPGPG